MYLSEWGLYLVVAEEGRDTLKFTVFICTTSLNAREGTEYDDVQIQGACWK